MSSIHSTWRRYFLNRNEGLGTTYERFILHRYFERIKRRYAVESVLEAPSFGMTGISGINSLWWALKGARVTLVDTDEHRIALSKSVWKELSLKGDFVRDRSMYAALSFKDDSFDMAWNFAALWAVSHLEPFLTELTRVSRKAIFICIPNRLNIFNTIKPAFERKHTVLYGPDVHPAKIEEIMRKLKWPIQEQGLFDVPPWPDIAMSKEDLLSRMGLKGLSGRLGARGENSICIMDYFKGTEHEMEKRVLKYAFLENAPLFFKRLWAHHQYIIFAPKQERRGIYEHFRCHTHLQ